MTLEQIIEEIRLFNTDGEKDEFEVTEFYDRISEEVSNLSYLSIKQIGTLSRTLFDYLSRQAPEEDENFSFIHLIEGLFKTDYGMYDRMLLQHCEEFPSMMALLLLNRFINGTKTDEKSRGLEILNVIHINPHYSLIIREAAKEFLDYQKNKEA